MSGYLRPCVLGALVSTVTVFSATYWLTQPARAHETTPSCAVDNPNFPTQDVVDGQMRLLAGVHDSAAAVKATLAELSRLADEECKRKSKIALAHFGKRGWLSVMVGEFLSRCGTHQGVNIKSCLDTFVGWKRAAWAREDLTKKVLKDLDTKAK